MVEVCETRLRQLDAARTDRRRTIEGVVAELRAGGNAMATAWHDLQHEPITREKFLELDQ
jgi:hypothetical protein